MYKKRDEFSKERKKGSLVTRVEENVRGGSLMRFRPDEYYDQDGKGMLADVFRGDLQGLKRT